MTTAPDQLENAGAAGESAHEPSRPEPVIEEPAADSRRIDFFDLTLEDLVQLLQQRFGEPRYRAVQLFEWVYRLRTLDFSLMTNIRRELRDALAEVFDFPTAKILDRQISTDGTRKYLLELDKGAHIEAVMIKQPERMTLCVSSQVGCGMGCAFCRTATMGFRRHLSASEIVRQVRAVAEDSQAFGQTIDNVVFMGMGEPLHNYDGVVRALKVLVSAHGFSIPARKITVSTSGLVPAIERFGREDVGVSLAISLNATTDEIRTQVMPVNKKYPIAELLRALKEMPLGPRKRITIEYVMLSGVNDTDLDLARLPRLLHGLPVKVNLIPYNENAGLGFRAPPRDRVDRWVRSLKERGLDVTVRWSKGADIDAACGQLAVRRDADAKSRRSLALVSAGVE